MTDASSVGLNEAELVRSYRRIASALRWLYLVTVALLVAGFLARVLWLVAGGLLFLSWRLTVARRQHRKEVRALRLRAGGRDPYQEPYALDRRIARYPTLAATEDLTQVGHEPLVGQIISLDATDPKAPSLADRTARSGLARVVSDPVDAREPVWGVRRGAVVHFTYQMDPKFPSFHGPVIDGVESSGDAQLDSA